MLDVGKDIVSHFKHSDLSTNARPSSTNSTTARDQPNDETEKGDPNVVEKQASAGVLSDCRLFIQDVATVGRASPT